MSEASMERQLSTIISACANTAGLLAVGTPLCDPLLATAVLTKSQTLVPLADDHESLQRPFHIHLEDICSTLTLSKAQIVCQARSLFTQYCTMTYLLMWQGWAIT
jgi:hypothetical protein